MLEHLRRKRPRDPNQRAAANVDEATSEAAPEAMPADESKDKPQSEPARAKKSLAQQRRERAKKSAAARQGKR